MIKKSKRLLSIVLIFCMMLAIVPAFAEDATAATSYDPTEVYSGTRYVWNVANLTASSDQDGFSIGSASGSVNNASNVTVQLSNDGINWSSGVAASNGATSDWNNNSVPGYIAQYIKITPADGYYIKYLVVACDDGNGYNCQSVGNGSAYTSVLDLRTGSVILDTESNSSDGEDFYHRGVGDEFHIFVHLEQTPDPVYLVYDVASKYKDAVESKLNGSDLVDGNSLVGITSSYTITRESDNDPPTDVAVAFKYARRPEAASTPIHTVLSPVDAAKSYTDSNGVTYVFSHWDVENYTTVSDPDNAFPTLSGSLSDANAEHVATYAGDEYRISSHTKLLAVYEPADLTVTKSLINIENDEHFGDSDDGYVPKPAVAVPGDVITWNIALQNDSSAAATMHVTDVLTDALGVSGEQIVGWKGYVENGDNWTEVSFTQNHQIQVDAKSTVNLRVTYKVTEANVGEVLVNTAIVGGAENEKSTAAPVFTFFKELVETEPVKETPPTGTEPPTTLGQAYSKYSGAEITFSNGEVISLEKDTNGEASVTLLYKLTVTGEEGETYSFTEQTGSTLLFADGADISNNEVYLHQNSDADNYALATLYYVCTFNDITFTNGKATVANTAVFAGKTVTHEEEVEEDHSVDVKKSITKIGDMVIAADTPDANIPSATVGDVIEWTVTVRNTSSTKVSGLKLEDHLHCHCNESGTPSHSCGTPDIYWNGTKFSGSFDLAVNETKTFTVKYKVQSTDIGHDIHNNVKVYEPDSNNDTDSDPDLLDEDDTPGIPTMSFNKKVVVVGGENKDYGEFEVVSSAPPVSDNVISTKLGVNDNVPSEGSYTITPDNTSTEVDETELTLIFSDDKNDSRYSHHLLYKLTVTGREGRKYVVEDNYGTFVGVYNERGEALGEYNTTNTDGYWYVAPNGSVNVTIPADNDNNIEGVVYVYYAKQVNYSDVETVSKITNVATMTNGKTLTDEVNVTVDIEYTKGLHVIKNFKGVLVDGEIIETSTVTAGDKLVWYITVFNNTKPEAGTDGTISEINLTDNLDGVKLSFIDLTTVGQTTVVDQTANLNPSGFALKVNQYARFKAEYTVKDTDVGNVIVNTATASHGDHQHTGDAPPVPVASLVKDVILDKDYAPSLDNNNNNNIDYDLLGVDFFEDGNVIFTDDEDVTLLYKLTATVPEGTTYYLKDENAAYLAHSSTDTSNVSVIAQSDYVEITVSADNDNSISKTDVTVYMYKTYAANDITGGVLTNTATLSPDSDDTKPIKATEEVPAEVDDFDFDFDSIPTPVTGSVSVTKTVSGLVVRSGAEFKFSIYNSSGRVVDSFTLEAGQSKVIDGLTPGIYTITESGAEMFGYSLKTYVNGSYRLNGSYEFEVYAGEETGVTYNNRYTIAAALNTNDHFAYIVGYADGTVKPNNPITRAEAATIFFRLMTDASREAYWSTTNSFDDVDADKWYNNAISTLESAGIVDGDSFRPNDNITRAELAVMATKFSQMSNTSVNTVTFTDIQGHWAQAEIEYAAAIGWVKGYSDGTFKPDQQITRAEAMTLINRVLERAVSENGMEDNMVAWPDNTPDDWYYEDVQEATNSHYYVRAKNQPVDGYNFNYEVWRGIMEPRDWTELENSWAKAANDSENVSIILS